MAILTLASVVYMSLKVTSNQSGFGEYVSYKTMTDDASGIFPKTPIKIAGINAGRIKSIELYGNKALIKFEVLKKVKITKGSKLRIKTVGFLGDKYLEISINRESLDILNENSEVESYDGGGITKLTKDAGEALNDLKLIIKSLKGSIAPEGKEAPVTKILSDIKAFAANTKELTASLKRVISGNEKRIGKLVKDFSVFADQLRYNFDKNQRDSLLSEVKGVVANLDKMTSDLKDVVANVKQGKGTVGQLFVEDEIADEVKETLSGVKKLVGKIDAVRTELSLFVGGNTLTGAESNIGLKIYPSPERFYLLGLSTSKFGVESEKLTTTSLNGGVEQVETEKVVEKDTYRLNIQLGRKVQNWTFRAGLIESSGGIGVNYYYSPWKTNIGAEAFDYRDDKGLNYRLLSEVHLWNVFYGKASFEDIANDSRNATFSVGLRFLDEDLKGLLGFFL